MQTTVKSTHSLRAPRVIRRAGKVLLRRAGLRGTRSRTHSSVSR